MAIINVNGISGINSITAQSGSLNFYTAAGNNLPISAETLNVGTGASVSSPATNVLTLGTNNSERVRINSSGTVGVNTTAIDSQLEVHSAASKINTVTIKTSAGASGYAGLAFMAGQTTAGREKAAIYFQETNGGAHYTGDIVFALNSTSGSAVQVSTSDERVRITSSGNLGIGTVSPSSMLHLLQSSGNAKITIQRSNAAANTDDYGSILWRSSAANNNGAIGVARESAENNGYMYFSTGSGGTLTERARITGVGSFGIGTVNPSALLHIVRNDSEAQRLSASGANQGIWVSYTAGSPNVADLKVGVDGAAGGTYVGGSSAFVWNVGNSPLVFGTNNTERLRIDSSGRVTTPYQPAFRAVDNSVNITLTAGSPAVFPNTSVSGGFNTGGYYSTSTGRFTAPVAGVYYFQACLGTSGWSSGNTTQDHFTLRVNNNAYVYSIKRENADTANTANGYFTDYGTFTVYLNANDYVTVVPTYTKNSFGNPGYTWFEGFLLG